MFSLLNIEPINGCSKIFFPVSLAFSPSRLVHTSYMLLFDNSTKHQSRFSGRYTGPGNTNEVAARALSDKFTLAGLTDTNASGFAKFVPGSPFTNSRISSRTGIAESLVLKKQSILVIKHPPVTPYVKNDCANGSCGPMILGGAGSIILTVKKNVVSLKVSTVSRYVFATPLVLNIARADPKIDPVVESRLYTGVSCNLNSFSPVLNV